MKLSVICVCLLLLPALVSAQDEQKDIIVNAPIDAVKVHLEGAEVTHKQAVSVSAGRQTLIFNNLSPKFYEKTIQLSLSGGIKILSISSQTDYLNRREDTPKIKILRDSVERMRFDIRQTTDEMAAYQQEREVMRANQGTKGQDKDLSLENLQKTADFFRQRILNINQEVSKLERKLEEQNRRLFDLKLQMYELNANQIALAQIAVVVESPSAQTTQAELKYIVGDAGWAANYDLYAGEVSKPIQLTYRGMAYNNTGVDWKNVKLTLSTADPLQSAVQPTLSVWNLNNSSSNIYQLEQQRITRSQSYNNVQDQIANYDLNDNNRANNVFKDTKRGQSYRIQSDELQYKGSISIVQQIMGEDFKSQVNYNTESFQKFQERNKPRPDVAFGTIDLPDFNVDFDIAQRFTIPSDKKPYSIEITSHNFNAEYSYLCVPKMDEHAYLIARILDWEELNFISGTVNIYNNNKFIAQSALNINSLSDTLFVSLGRDNNITVKRSKVKATSKKQFMGGSKTITAGYEIAIRNAKGAPINIEIQDQTPISDDKDVTVTLTERGGAEFDDKKGFLIWKAQIASNETKTFNFAFSVKAPKEKVIRVEVSKERKMMAPKF
jgi:hypothetical protein